MSDNKDFPWWMPFYMILLLGITLAWEWLKSWLVKETKPDGEKKP